MSDGRGGWQPRGENNWRPYGSRGGSGGGGWRGGGGGGGNPRGRGNWQQNSNNNWRGGWNRGGGGGGGGRGFVQRGNGGGWRGGGGRGRGGRNDGPIDAKRCVMPAMWANPWAQLETEYEKEYGVSAGSEFEAPPTQQSENPFPSAEILAEKSEIPISEN
uniref:Uncharacterized protein n=1 Tax=Caenorhabditis japonica TaxID=281687 RepID=A0A8R1EN56_CAEJA